MLSILTFFPGADNLSTMMSKIMVLISLSLSLSLSILYCWQVNAQILDSWNTLLTDFAFESDNHSFCIKNPKSEIVSSNLNQRIKPASVTKLYVTLWALEKLGRDYRYQTKLYYDGENLHIEGGQDPFFVEENIFYVLNLLNKHNIKKIKRLSFSNNFFLNWSDDSRVIVKLLYRFFNKWNQEIRTAFFDTQKRLKNLGGPIQLKYPKMRLAKVSSKKKILKSKATTVITIKSSPLYRHLKEVNSFSNNFYFQKMFELLGDSLEFSKYLNDKFNISTDIAYFYTGSGLGENYTTCQLTLRVLDELYRVANNQGLNFWDIMAVPGVDHGTLAKRFTEENYKQTICAKTGTLATVSALAGALYDINGPSFFGIFNATSDLDSARRLQDIFIKDIFRPQGEFSYDKREFISLEGVITY